MRWIKTILGEIFGLFVDDGTFAGVILAWLIVVDLVLPHVTLPSDAKAPILFVGLAAILVASAAQRARR